MKCKYGGCKETAIKNGTLCPEHAQKNRERARKHQAKKKKISFWRKILGLK